MEGPVYDVYIFVNNRWQLVKQFQGPQRDTAVEYGEFMYREKHVLAYRVIEETLDASGDIRERKIMSRKKVDVLPKAGSMRAAAPRPASRPAATPAAKPAAPQDSPATTTTLPPGELSRRGRQAILVLLAALALGLLTLLAGVLKVFGLFGMSGGLLGGLGLAFLATAGIGLGMLSSAPDERGFLMRQLVNLLSESPPPAPAPAPLPTPAAVGAAPAPEAPAATPADSTADALVQLDPEDPESRVAPERHRGLLSVAQGFVTLVRAWIARLLGQPGAAENNSITPHMRFGLHLFIAGLCEQAGRLKQWQGHELRFVLAESLGGLFGDPVRARRFAGNYQEYLAEPRYMEMYRAGLTWDGRLEDGMPAGAGLVERWLGRRDGSASAPISVMFTDIIGSTDFTQRHGDKLHLELVQAHDRIVRQAVEDFGGRWIKHTGDGAMLSFEQPLQALRAALQIQSEIRVHNDIMPALPLRLRIGISSGQPLQAGDDLFGSTVQLAARVCALADAGQIMVAEAVYLASGDTGFSFLAQGLRQLKGFPEPQAVYAVNLG